MVAEWLRARNWISRINAHVTQSFASEKNVTTHRVFQFVTCFFIICHSSLFFLLHADAVEVSHSMRVWHTTPAHYSRYQWVGRLLLSCCCCCRLYSTGHAPPNVSKLFRKVSIKNPMKFSLSSENVCDERPTSMPALLDTVMKRKRTQNENWRKSSHTRCDFNFITLQRQQRARHVRTEMMMRRTWSVWHPQI